MGTSKKGTGLGAWLLTIVMVLSLVTVPAKSVEAAENVIVTDALNSGKDVYVELQADGKVAANSNDAHNWPEKELTKYNVIVHNNSDTVISDWNVTITYNSITCFGGGWNNAEKSGNSIVVGTYKGVGDDGEVWTNAQIEAGNTANGAGYQIASDDTIQSVTLTYQVGESSGTASKDDTMTDPSVLGEKNDAVTATLTKSNIAGEYYEYAVKVKNGSSSTIKDWIIAVPLTGITKTNDWSSWATVQAYYTDSYLYIRPIKDTVKSISAGASVGSESAEGSDKISYYASSDGSSIPSNAIVYFSTTSSDAFSAVTDNANGGSSDTGSSSGGGSTGDSTFDGSNIGSIDTSLDYNFAKLLQYSLYFYDANMCGNQVSETSLYSKDLYGGWRGDCHVNDKFTYNNKTYSAVGGYHDAGDHVKFGLPMAQAMTALGIGYHEFGEAFDELGQTSHLKTIVDYYCTYVKSCTVLNTEGNQAEAFCYQVGNGDADHANWTAPEVENESATKRTDTLVATSSNPATDIVSGTAAALALNYMNFGNEEDLKYAKALFAFAKNNSKREADYAGSFYHSGWGEWQDEYCLAAALLYQITKDASYATEYTSNDKNSGNIEKPYGWENAYQAAVFYAPDSSSTKSSQERTIRNWFNGVANQNSDKYYCGDSWGSARVNCNVQLMMLVSDKHEGTNTYGEWCRYQMSTILGNNSTGKNLICGYNTKSPVKPHHRAASGYSGWDDFNNNRTQKYTLYGALCGGPTSSDYSTYNDSVTDATSNEVTLDYNAGLVGATAALYLLYKDSKDAGFTNQTINADFYGGSNFSGTTETVLGVTLDKTEISIEEGKTQTLTATVTPSGAATVTWKSSDSKVATVSNGKVTAVKEGTATITATAGGKSASCTVTVTAAPVARLEADSAGVTCTALEYGYTNPAAGTVTISNNGTAEASGVTATLENGSSFTITQMPSESISVGGTATVGVTPKTGLSAGTYKDTLKVTYNSSLTLSVPVTFTVNKRAVTVAADNVFKTYGDANPALTYRVTSGSVVSGDSLNITCSTTASKTSDAGSYPVTVTPGSNPNYEITTQAGTLTVNKKPVASIVFPSAADIEVGQTLASSTFSGGDTSYGTFAWANPATAPARGTTNADVVLTLATAAKKNYSFSGITGYNESAGTITQSVTVNVNRAGLPAIIFPTASAIQYGQTLSESVLTGGSTQYGTFTWVNGAENMTIIGTRSYAVVFEWNQASKSEYGILDSDEDATLIKSVTVKVEKADNTAIPQKAVLVNRTSSSITVQEVSGYEYSKDGKTWQDSNVFTGLSSFTGYNIYTRIKETDYYKASDKSVAPLSVYTLVANPYTIDVSKLRDANYVDALRTASGTATVSYDTGTDVLTLTDSSKPYTITGSNNNVTVKTAAGTTQTITLSNITVKDLDVTNTSNAIVTIVGTAKVTGSIIADNTSVTLRGSGTLNVETIKADNGTVNIEGGTVNAGTVTAKNINISGGIVTITGTITAVNDISITGGTVTAKGGISAEGKAMISGSKTNATATGSDGNPAISASDITITDASVTATGGEGASAISSTGNITMENAEVTVNTTGNGSAPAIQAGEGDEYKITIDGGNVTGNSVDNMYSKNPVDSQGNIIATYKVSIMDEAANRNETKAINAGSGVTLQAAGKKGYKATWKDQTGKTYVDGIVVTIESDCSFTAVYTKISVTSVKLTVPAVELEVGKTATATVKVLPADAADTSVTWSSGNPAVAAVDSKGVITAKAKGSAVITVTSNDTKLSDSVTITVKEASKPEEGSTVETDVKASSILLKASVKGAASVPVKSTYKLAPKKSMTLKVSFAPENAVKEKVTFKSSNTKIAKVNSKGKITAGKKAGKATITVTSENGLKKTFKVQVMKKAVTKVKIKASKKTVKVKKTLQLKAITSPSKKNASNCVYWKSSNPKIATVSSTGKVKAIKKGKVKITAVATDGSGKKATITIQVKK